MPQMPKNEVVSVCIPVFNESAYVRGSVNSILRQTHRDVEVIVVDDGSSDGTLEALSEIRDSRLRVIENDDNRGNLYRRNQAFEQCSGDYVAIMDADDICQPDRLERQVAALRRGYRLCGSWVVSGLSPALVEKIWHIPTEGAVLARSALFGSPLANPSVMMSRDLLDEEDFRFDSAFYPAADYHAWAKKIFLQSTPTFVVPAPLLFRRLHGASISHRNAKLQDQKADEVRALLLRETGVDEDLIALHNRALREKVGEDDLLRLKDLYQVALRDLRPDLFSEGSLRIRGNNEVVHLKPAGAAAAGPIISVIVPAYNTGRLLEECVVSVLDHNKLDIELIVVDDGSTDDTPDICAELSARFDKRLRIIRRANGGLSEARQTGLDAALGEYIYFLDGDDFLAPGAVDLLLREAKRTNADVVVSGHAAYYEHDGSTEPRLKVEDKLVYSSDIFDHFASRVFGYIAANKLIRTKLARKIRFEPGIYHEDELYCPELFLRATRVATVPEMLYLYRQRSGSITSEITEKHVRDWLYLTRKVLELCQSYGLSHTKSKGFAVLMRYLLEAPRRKLDRMEAPSSELRALVGREVSEMENRLILMDGVGEVLTAPKAPAKPKAQPPAPQKAQPPAHSAAKAATPARTQPAAAPESEKAAQPKIQPAAQAEPQPPIQTNAPSPEPSKIQPPSHKDIQERTRDENGLGALIKSMVDRLRHRQ